MSEEKDWADFYEQHKDDPDMWGEPEEGTPSAPRGRLSVTVTVRFAPDEASDLREVARELGASYSDIVRRAVRTFVYSYMAARDEAIGFPAGSPSMPRPDPEGRHDYSFRTGSKTLTGDAILAGR